jgi:hypothetical protein
MLQQKSKKFFVQGAQRILAADDLLAVNKKSNSLTRAAFLLQ